MNLNDEYPKGDGTPQVAPTTRGPAYDYIHQAWTIDGRYIRCGHPESMDCHCYGRDHAGESAVV